MTVTSQRAGVTGTSAGPNSAPTPRLPGRKGDRRPVLAALAVLMILGGGLISGLLVYRSGQRADFLVLARDVAPGQRLSDDDLGVARIAGTGARAIPADRRGQVVGEYLTVGAFTGMLLTNQMLQATPSIPSGGAVVGVALDDGQAPAGGVRLGDVVRILDLPTRGSAGSPAVLVDAARVVGVGGGASSSGGGVFAASGGTGSGVVVSVLVPAARAADVATASIQQQAALVLLPPGTKTTLEPGR